MFGPHSGSHPLDPGIRGSVNPAIARNSNERDVAVMEPCSNAEQGSASQESAHAGRLDCIYAQRHGVRQHHCVRDQIRTCGAADAASGSSSPRPGVGAKPARQLIEQPSLIVTGPRPPAPRRTG